jgi:tetratricopeptide (TPR) repeat protein
MNKLLTIACSLSCLLLLEGCRTLPEKAASHTPVKNSPLPTITPPTEYRPFSTDTLYSLLVAEVAATRQNFKLTLEHYIEQAHITNDKAVIARASRIAQFFRDHPNSLEMGQLWLTQEPNNIEALTLVANAHLELNKPLLALDYTERLLQQLSLVSDPDLQRDGGAFTETIANYSKRSPKDTILSLLSRFDALAIQYPDLSGIKVGLSILHQANGEINTAFTWVRNALTQTPERTSAIVQEILLLQQDKQTPLAISKLKSRLEKDPSNSRLRLVYARLLTETNIAESYKQFVQLSEQSPKQLDLKFSRAILGAELNKADEVKPLFLELLNANYQPDTVLFYLGHIEESQDQLTTAQQYYLRVTKGENYLPAQNRAARIYIEQGDIPEAQQLFSDLRDKFPAIKERAYVTESNLLVRNKSDDVALPLLNTAIKEFPDNSDLRYNRSTVYERQGQLALMESDFRHVLTLDPDNVYALNGLGYFLTIRTERYDEAYQLIARAFALKPSDAAILDSMGWISFKMGRIDEAITHLQKAFSLYPDPEVAAHLGEALWAKGKHQEAKTIWESNLHTNPDAPEILETLKRLDVAL